MLKPDLCGWERSDKEQLVWQRHHEQILLLHVALRLGFLPVRPFFHCFRIRHLSICSLQPPRISYLRLHHNVRSLLVHTRSSSHDVSIHVLLLNMHFSNTPQCRLRQSPRSVPQRWSRSRDRQVRIRLHMGSLGCYVPRNHLPVHGLRSRWPPKRRPRPKLGHKGR